MFPVLFKNSNDVQTVGASVPTPHFSTPSPAPPRRMGDADLVLDYLLKHRERIRSGKCC